MSSISWKPEASIASLSDQEERSLARELGQEGGFRLFHLLLCLHKQLPLLCQLSGQHIALCGELAALLPFGAQCGVGFAQLLLKSSIGS